MALDKAGISQKDFDTYKQVRQDLMQNPNVAPILRQPEDLQSQALDRYLQRERTGMSSEEFVSIHGIVQNNPELRAAAEEGAPLLGRQVTEQRPASRPESGEHVIDCLPPLPGESVGKAGRRSGEQLGGPRDSLGRLADRLGELAAGARPCRRGGSCRTARSRSRAA